MGFRHFGQQITTASFGTVAVTHAGKASSRARMRANFFFAAGLCHP
jgi:hypothetical protein